MDIYQEKLQQEFRSWLIAQDFSDNSLRTYTTIMRQDCWGISVEEINNKTFFNSLKERLKSAGKKPKTVACHVMIVKKFLAFIADEKGIPIVNLFSIKCRTPRPVPPVYLEKDEITAIRNLPLRGLNALRTRTLFEILLYTGCRVSEISNADQTAIDWKKNELPIIGKGNKPRTVFLGGSATWIKRYLESRINDAPPLFLGQYGTRLSMKDMELWIKRLGEEAGLLKSLHPHMLRTTFATHMIRSGVDARTLQYMLGHDNVETTLKFYVGVSEDHARETHKQFSNALA